MTESDYMTLYCMNDNNPKLLDILNRNAPNLTVCPECQVDDFAHIEGCNLGRRCAFVVSTLICP